MNSVTHQVCRSTIYIAAVECLGQDNLMQPLYLLDWF